MRDVHLSKTPFKEHLARPAHEMLLIIRRLTIVYISFLAAAATSGGRKIINIMTRPAAIGVAYSGQNIYD